MPVVVQETPSKVVVTAPLQELDEELEEDEELDEELELDVELEEDVAELDFDVLLLSSSSSSFCNSSPMAFSVALRISISSVGGKVLFTSLSNVSATLSAQLTREAASLTTPIMPERMFNLFDIELLLEGVAPHAAGVGALSEKLSESSLKSSRVFSILSM